MGKTRKHRGGNNSSRNIFAWQQNPAYLNRKTYKTTAENEGFNAQQANFWSGQNRPVASNKSSMPPVAPRRNVPVLYTGVNYDPELPRPSVMNRVRGFFGRGAPLQAANTRRNNARFPGVGVATRRLNVGRRNNNASTISNASSVSI